MLATISSSHGGIISKEQLLALGSDAKVKALRKLALLVQKGTLRSNYDDDIWYLTDQKANYRLVFNYRHDALASVCEKNEVRYEDFVDDLKVYALIRVGTCSLASLRKMVSYVIDQTITSSYYLLDTAPDASDVSQTMYYTEFVRLIAPTRTTYIEMCDWLIANVRTRNATVLRAQQHPCALNEFQSYFKFDSFLREWWAQWANEQRKLYYFPLFLFWVLTTILPLRVTEFCFLPFNCIYEQGETFHIIIRRSRLKGPNEDYPKIHSYTIEGDYTTHSYEIPKWLYNEIDWYRRLSEGYPRNYQLLFSVDFMKSLQKDTRAACENVVFDSENLGDLLKSFYAEVIIEKYHMEIVSEEDLEVRFQTTDGSYELYDNEIMMILAKHTRHLAMINLILRGCNPILIKEFAGHTNGATSYNYYGNISKTVRCVTKILYDKSKNRRQQKKNTNITTPNPLSLMIDENEEYIEVDAGKCYSKNLLRSNPYDCSMCGGDCQNCGYLLPNKSDSVIPNEDRIDKEMDFIARLLYDERIDEKLTEFQIKLNLLQRDIANLATRIWQEEELNAQKTKI